MTTDGPNGPARSEPREQKSRPKPAPSNKTVDGDIKSAADKVRADTGRAAEAVQEEIKSVGEQAKGMADEQKNAVAANLDGIAGAIRHAADDLDEGSPGARVTREAAERMSRLAKSLKEHSVGDLIAMAEDFGRRQPVAFLGASALAGFVASRFVRASSHRSHQQGSTDGRAAAGEEPAGIRTDANRPSVNRGASAQGGLP